MSKASSEAVSRFCLNCLGDRHKIRFLVEDVVAKGTQLRGLMLELQPRYSFFQFYPKKEYDMISNNCKPKYRQRIKSHRKLPTSRQASESLLFWQSGNKELFVTVRRYSWVSAVDLSMDNGFFFQEKRFFFQPTTQPLFLLNKCPLFVKRGDSLVAFLLLLTSILQQG